MTTTPDNRVLFASLAGTSSPILVLLAVRHAWPLLTFSRAAQALRDVWYRRPDVVIVQLSIQLSEDFELVRLLPAAAKRVSSIVVATSHHDEIERAVRMAGANCYLPTTADTTLLERVVAEILDRREALKTTTRRRDDGAMKNRMFLSFSSLSTPESPGRRARSPRRPLRSADRLEDGRIA